MHFSIDIEADGPIPGQYSMTEFGIVIVDGKFDKTFHGQMHPMTVDWDPNALAISGRTREEVLAWPFPGRVMLDAVSWVREHAKTTRPIFWADNNGFDYMFWHWYCMYFRKEDPFGWSSNNIKNLAQGVERKLSVKNVIKKHKVTPHDHNPVNDAKGNAEVLWHYLNKVRLV